MSGQSFLPVVPSVYGTDDRVLTKEEFIKLQSQYNIHIIPHILKNTFEKTYDFINKKYKDVLTNIFSEKLYRFLNDLDEIPKCKHCGQRNVSGFRSITDGYRAYCSKSCRAFDMQPTYKSTLKRKYGDEFYNNERKRKATYKKRYDNECYFKSKDYKTKIKETYGVDCAMHSDIVKDRIKQTSMRKYNTEYPNQSPIVQRRSQNNSFKFKQYTLPSGKIINLQGYEPFAMTYLLYHYIENDIITDKSLIPRLWYMKNNKKCVYYADIFIKSINTIVEVKSTWTNKLNMEVNEMKKQAVLNSGFKFEKLIFDSHGALINA